MHKLHVSAHEHLLEGMGRLCAHNQVLPSRTLHIVELVVVLCSHSSCVFQQYADDKQPTTLIISHGSGTLTVAKAFESGACTRRKNTFWIDLQVRVGVWGVAHGTLKD